MPVEQNFDCRRKRVPVYAVITYIFAIILFLLNSLGHWTRENMTHEYTFYVCGSWTKFAISLFTVHTLVFQEMSMLDTDPLLKACVLTYSCANTDYCKGN